MIAGQGLAGMALQRELGPRAVGTINNMKSHIVNKVATRAGAASRWNIALVNRLTKAIALQRVLEPRAIET
jgi:hypothetical protein